MKWNFAGSKNLKLKSRPVGPHHARHPADVRSDRSARTSLRAGQGRKSKKLHSSAQNFSFFSSTAQQTTQPLFPPALRYG